MTGTLVARAAAALLIAVSCSPGAAAGATSPAGELLRQQSAAERAGCGGVQRARAAGADAALVVRTAVELGYGPCHVIRCALAGRCPSDGAADLEPVIRGAVAAGVPADVVARCAVDACADPGAAAALLADVLLEPNYCYFGPRPLSAPAPLPPPLPVIDRSHPQPQASPFTF
ncbi:MAG TPA: hypothetical protein VN317_07755 [Candidatus Methanoperedens sp.]|nr:hypothetical protein [Candidatus Methanoperedens sp.]